MEDAVDVAVHACPEGDADEIDDEECGPCLRYSEVVGTPGEGGESESAVSGAKERFCPGFNECGEGDGEFADAEPAGAAVDVGYQGVVARGLDGEIGG